jgi:uncharacterized pyridoxamine 5'-phosphate oxidase family protein
MVIFFRKSKFQINGKIYITSSNCKNIQSQIVKNISSKLEFVNQTLNYDHQPKF